MVSVFIQFGGAEAEMVGLCFRKYLLDYRLDPFLAGKKSRDIPPGIQDYWGYIKDKIRTSDIMVSICCEKFDEYCGVKKELLFIEEKRNDLIIIPFIKRGASTPKYCEHRWHPLYFDVETYDEKFCEILVAIYQWVYKILLIKSETRPLDDNSVTPMEEEIYK